MPIRANAGPTVGERLYSGLFEQSSLGVVRIASASGRFLETNQRFSEMVGYSPAELQQLGLPDIVLQEDLGPVLAELGRLLSGHTRHYAGELRCCRADGTAAWVRMSALPLWGPGEEPSMYVLLVEDIGDLRRAEELSAELAAENQRLWKEFAEHDEAEERLRASEELYSSLFSHIGIGISLISREMEILFLNPVMRKWNPHVDPAGHPVCYRCFNVPPRDDVCSYCPTIHTLRDGEIHTAVTDTPTEAGIMNFRIVSAPVRAVDGSVLAAIEVVEDITEQVRAERELHRTNDMLSAVIAAAPVAVIGMDLDGNVQNVWNAAAERMLGWSAAEVMGRQLPSVPVENRDEFRRFRERIRNGEFMAGVEVSRTRRDGTPIDYSIYASPLHDAEGRITGNISVLVDVTDRKRVETERRNLESQLLQAQKMEAIGQLAGGIAHDFNNILTAIIGYSEILARRLDKGSRLKHYADQISLSAERAAELTGGLLAFSRKQPLHTSPTELGEVVRGLRRMLARIIPEDIEFRTSFAEEDLVVMADKGQLEQVIMNLVTNAKDAMPNGGALSIAVSSCSMESGFAHAHGIGEPGRYACICVSDTGHGMDEETMNRIFEPFFTTKEVGKGTGLGMAIIYGIIRQHNGCIDVSSEPGKGATFHVYLPLMAVEKQAELEVPDAEPPGGTETILLVEDDVNVRELHRTMLEEAGYTVIAAVDGQDALDRFRERSHEVDLLVTDVVMPRINGRVLYESVCRIRPGMKAIFVSGYTRDIMMERGMLEDECNFINKPVSPSELLFKVRSLLDSV